VRKVAGTLDRNTVFNLPNNLSLLRIGLAPFLVAIFLFSSSRVFSFLAALLFSLASLTDWLDGYFARKQNIVTPLGKFLDPLADKLLVAVALIMLIHLGRVPSWMVAVIIGREIAVTGLRVVAATEGMSISASPLGKYKTTFQILAVIGLLLHYEYFGVDFHVVGVFFLWIALFMTALSGIDYFVKFLRGVVADSAQS
jgi:CDP-diacylglycerol--glycerol-3-phosphate 3-phosphatidyltransferase